MELKQVMGDRSTIRFFDPDKPVEPEKIQRMLEAANRSSRAVNADFVKAVVAFRDEIDEETREALKTPTTSVALDLAPVAIFWYGNGSYADGGAERLKDLVDLGALPVTHGWSHTYVDDVAFGQVVKPASEEPAVASVLMAVESGQAIAHALLMAVDEGLGVGLHAFTPEPAQKAFDIPDDWMPLWVMLVGYTAEDRKGGGQRPRRPLGSSYFRGNANTPWDEDSAVTDGLKADGLIQEPMDADARATEVRELAERFGLPL